MSPPPSDGSGTATPSRRFEDVDWDGVAESPTAPAWNLRGFLLGLAALVAGFWYEHVEGNAVPFASNLEPLDWLFAASLLAIGAFVLVPLATNPRETARYWRRLRERPAGLLSLGFVLALFVVGLLSPLFVSEPTGIAFQRAYQPPFGLGIDAVHLFTSDACVGRIADATCYGTLTHPLGTTETGKDLLPFVLLGARTSLAVAVVSATLIVPTGLAVGLLAAHAGGRTDGILMQVAEVSQTVPAVIVYMLFWGWNAEYRLLVLVAVFGMTSWGGLARLVRNEALQLRERPYVQAARDAGASRYDVMRHHLLPNISRSVLTNVTLQVPLIVVTEAALSFIIVASPFDGEPVTLGDPTVVSWGQVINMGTGEAGLLPGWWITVIPGSLLVATMLAFTLLGRTLGDVLDPRPK
ncbi:MAG: ABC transporter permease [Haloarculaceae archaeon]